ncbi:MAG: DHA2 family efflux MFS transporter permease subunit [Microthrixaceae bacterium]
MTSDPQRPEQSMYRGAGSDTSATTAGDTAGNSPDGTGTDHGSYRWWAMGVVLFGTFMVVLDTTVVNLGLPALQRDFNTITGVEWVVTAYLAAVGVSQMTSGWAADRFGRKQALVFALVVFTAGSVLCAISPTLPILVAARIVQGVGGGILMPVAMSVIYELFEPAERGRAMGLFGIAVMAAPAIGPVLGGGLVESVGWRWLFLINVPIGIIGIPMAMKVLRDSGFRNSRPFDGAGLALSGVGLALLMVGLSLGGTEGWLQPVVLVLILAGLVGLVLFTVHALRSEHPLVEMRILANPIFAIGMVSLGLLAVAQYSRLVYIPLELGTTRGVNEFQIGLVMLPSALGIAMMMPVGGRLVDKVGARIPVMVGVGVYAVSFWGLAHLSVDSPLWLISGYLFLGGLGSGLAMMAPNIVSLNAVKTVQVSQAAGLSSVTRQVSAAIGTAILAAIYATIRPVGDPGVVDQAVSVQAYNNVFLISFGILVVSVGVGWFLPGKRVATRLQEERRAELAEMEGSMSAQEAVEVESALTAGMEA